MFASKHQLEFKSTSRRDDLISLCYLLIFMACNKELPFFDPDLSEIIEDQQ